MSIDTLDTRENAEHVLARGPVVVPTCDHHKIPTDAPHAAPPCAHPVDPAVGHRVPAEDDPVLAPAVVRPALLAGEEHEAPDPWIFRGTD
ncbi:hypothetical protein [Streptomyces sp. NPDC051921]|uniref:hypothetical protein n=1 Tax=Streptomyces sp. NPDC051921 TaxID=3155806 RepID=UPI00342DE0CF